MDLFGGTIRTLEGSLDYAATKNRTIASNIANADTPNYKAKKTVFSDMLETELAASHGAKRTHPKHFQFSEGEASSYRVLTDRSTLFNHNGNNVDLDKEMAELAKNQIYYQGLTDRINGKFSSLQKVIRGGN
ncbi:flagellar basal body rod protein FlgB [Virgibacillus sediminis]|uniref:Flagellar basal body rod protein FlgB n=1 Tax=Virgibacillus sediminis TaxID=202260 RepID=A0ABV7AB84_9BACI